MDGSDAMALSMIVSMFDLAHTYMEPMETAIGGINAMAKVQHQTCNFELVALVANNIEKKLNIMRNQPFPI